MPFHDQDRPSDQTTLKTNFNNDSRPLSPS